MEFPQPSLPTRGAWIEMEIQPELSVGVLVAPHTGSVEQNFRKEVTKWTK